MKPRLDHDYTWYPLEIVRSPIAGWGVIAKKTIPKNEYVIEYRGKILNRKQAAAMWKRRKESDPIVAYQIDNKGYWTMDGGSGGSGAEAVNHSCDPNLESVHLGKRIYFRSIRRIKKGEELTVDYKFDWDPKELFPCLCGAKTCRGTINVPEEKKKPRR